MNEDKFQSLAQADHDTSAASHLPTAEILDRVRTTAGIVWAVLVFVVLATAFVVWRYAQLTTTAETGAKAISAEREERVAAVKQAVQSSDTALDRFIKEQFNPLSKEKSANEARITANIKVIEAQARITESQGVTITAILKQIEEWKPLTIEHREMYMMLKNGISNQDAFFRDKGYYAPSDPRSKNQTPYSIRKHPPG